MDITPYVNSELICDKEGHDWEFYVVTTGIGTNDIEQAGYCRRCHYDTHDMYHE